MSTQGYRFRGVHCDGVLLGYAFEGLGSALYKDKWQYTNFFSLNSLYDPETKKDTKEPCDQIKEEIFQIRASIESNKQQKLQVATDSIAEEIGNLITRLEKKERELKKKLSLMEPDINDLKDEKMEMTFNIKRQVEDALWDFSLRIWDRRGTQLNDIRGGKFDLKNSTFEKWDLPKNVWLEPEIVLLERVKVDNWLLQFREPENDDEWLKREFIKLDPNIRITKNGLFEQFKTERYSLSENRFNKAWKDFAPDHWKKPGRIKP